MEINEGKLFIVQEELPAAQGNFMEQKAGMSANNSKPRQWTRIGIPAESIPRLYSIDGHLYGANEESVVEFTDGGTTTRLLASPRRRPAASSLDALDSLCTPTLFHGPGVQLRISTCAAIY